MRPTPTGARHRGLGEIIADASIREGFDTFVGVVERLHPAVRTTATTFDLRVEYGGRALCRAVPYRELYHVQIGDDPVWEIRVRDRRAMEQALDRLLSTFLEMVSESPA